MRVQDLSAEPWVSSHPGMGWNDITTRICREHGSFDPDIRHRTNDAIVGLRLVGRGLAVMVIPQLAAVRPYPGVAIRDISGASLKRTIFAATRTADARRPSVCAALGAVRAVAAAIADAEASSPHADNVHA